MISLNTGILVTSANTPLDARTKVGTIANLTDGSITRPYVGLIVWVINEEKAYAITGVTGTLVTSYKPIGDDVAITFAYTVGTTKSSELSEAIGANKIITIGNYVASVEMVGTGSSAYYVVSYTDKDGVFHQITHTSQADSTGSETTKEFAEVSGNLSATGNIASAGFKNYHGDKVFDIGDVDTNGTLHNKIKNAVHVDVDTNNDTFPKTFAVKNIKGDTIGSIALSTAANGAAKLTFTDDSNNTFDAVLPNLTFDSQRQVLQYVDAGNQNHDLIRLSNLQIKEVVNKELGSHLTVDLAFTTQTVDGETYYIEQSADNTYTLGDLILALESNNGTDYILWVCDQCDFDPSDETYTYHFVNVGSINDVSLQADQVSFTSNSGLESTNVRDAIEEVKDLISHATIAGIYPDFSNTLYVVDANGYVGLKLDANGLDVAEISSHLTSLIEEIAGSGSGSGDEGDTPVVVDSTNWMYGKNIYSIGDSLCAGGVWQTTLANIVGANFDSAANELITEPSRTTIADGGNQDNAIALKELQDNGAKVDILFIENGNDSGYGKLSLGTISDVPFFKKQTINSIETYSSAEAAWTACQNGGGTIFNGTPMVGTRGRIQYSGGAIDSWFVSKDVNDWNDGSKWVRTVTTYAFIKGMLEYVCENFKNTKVFYLIPQWIEFPFGNVPSNFKYADGSINIAAWLTAKNRGGASAYNYEGLVSVIKACCAVYSIPVIDLSSEAGLNLFNAYPTYYGASVTGNVHPNNAGYVRWGETIARLLTGK